MGDFASGGVEPKAMATSLPHRPLQPADSFGYISSDVPAGMTLSDYRRRRRPRPRPRPWWRRLWRSQP
jgi:hypothetical protein